MNDLIINLRSGQTYAEVLLHHVESRPFYYEADILQDYIPSNLAALIRERDELVRLVSITLLDDVEAQLEEYSMGLKILGEKIFSPAFESPRKMSFFTRFPTAHGFSNSGPGQ